MGGQWDKVWNVGPGGATVRTRWRGEIIALQAKRALGRSLIAIGENTAVKGKGNAHVISGTLRRSIHTANVGYNGADDIHYAEVSELEPLNATKPSESAGGGVWAIEVGSWLPYACVEECGRHHQFMTPAVEEMQGEPSHRIVKQAFTEEGLDV